MPLSARRLAYATAAISLLGLSACQEDSAAIAVPDPAPPAFLAAADPLPYAEPAPVSWYGPDRGYQWAERAYGMQQAFHEAPPDYGFDYGGVEPWVWETSDEWAMYAEPWDDGYRYYYYEPGAAYPYFVRDDRYGYGFDAAGVLVALFDSDGDYLPQSYFYDAAPLAGRYYTRGRDLRNAARQARRVRVTETVWVERAPYMDRSVRPWLAAAERDDGWRAWRNRSGDRERRRFEHEERRRDEARRWARERRDQVQVAAANPWLRTDARDGRGDERRGERRQERFERAQARDDRGDRREDRRMDHRQDERRLAQAVRQERRAEAREDRRLERPDRGRAQEVRRQAKREDRGEPRRVDRGPERRQAAQAAEPRRKEQQAFREARAAEDRGRRQAAKAADRQGRDAAFRDRGGRPDRGGEARAAPQARGGDHGRPDRGAKPDRGGGKADRGGDHGGGKDRGGGKGGGKKD